MASKIPKTIEDVKRNKKYMKCLRLAYEAMEGKLSDCDPYFDSCPSNMHTKSYNKELKPILMDQWGERSQPIYCAYCQVLFPKVKVGGSCPCSLYGKQYVSMIVSLLLKTKENSHGKAK